MDNNAVSNPLVNIGRVHYLDQVRALALMMGILMHACYTYAYTLQNIWYLTDETSSMAITAGFLFFHLFRMPVFYLIAGFFANYLYQKRGVKGFLKHRLKRIGLPFVIFLPMILIAFNILIVFIVLYVPTPKLPPALQQAVPMIKARLGVDNGENPQTLNNSIDNSDNAAVDEIKIQTPGYSDNTNVSQEVSEPVPDETPANAGVTRAAKTDPQITQHLWFLYYLLLFCLCAALLQKISHPFITRIFNRIFSSPLYLLLVPLFMVPSLYHAGVTWAGPMHIIPRLWPFGYFGMFFLFGWHFFYHQDYLDKFKKYLQIMIILSIIALAFYFYYINEYVLSGSPVKEGLAANLFSKKMLLILLQAYLSVFLTIISLVLGKRFLNFGNKYMRFISDSSYWIYLIHFPLVTFIQVFFVTVPISGYFKLIISSAILLGIGSLTYRYMVRYSFIGTLLNGKRVRGAAD